MAYSGIYVARFEATSISTARTMVQVNAAATRALEIIRVWVSFSTTTSTATEVRLKQTTTAGTGSAFTVIRIAGESTATASATTNHTAEGSLGDVYIREYVNQLNGYLYLPVPEERIIVSPSGRFAVEFPSAPSAVTVSAGIIWGELG